MMSHQAVQPFGFNQIYPWENVRMGSADELKGEVEVGYESSAIQTSVMLLVTEESQSHYEHFEERGMIGGEEALDSINLLTEQLNFGTISSSKNVACSPTNDYLSAATSNGDKNDHLSVDNGTTEVESHNHIE